MPWEIVVSSAIEFVSDQLPRVTVKDVRRFADAVEIRDAKAFAAELQAFIHERIEAVAHSPSVKAEAKARDQRWKANALRRSDPRQAPSGTDMQGDRDELVQAFGQPNNLPIPHFAKLADKTRQQIYRDIVARRLLALDGGARGRKVPDWQLDPVKQQLTQTVLKEVDGVDDWTVYRALSEPLEGLGGRSPLDAVTSRSIGRVAEAVFRALGLQA